MLTSRRGAQHEAFIEPLIRTLKRLAMAAMRWLHMPNWHIGIANDSHLLIV